MDSLTPINAPRATPSPPTGVERIEVIGRKPELEQLSFWDMLDFINPLQHIPVVNTLYRELTGDTIKTPAKLVGSTLLGGAVGFAAAMVDSLIEEGTGKDVGGHVMALVRGDGERPSVAAAAPLQSMDTAQAEPREFIPDFGGAADRAADQGAPPSEREALLTAAQIAAQANVLGPLKRDPIVAAARPSPSSARAVRDPATAARAGRFMPLNPEATQGRDLRMPARRAADEVTVAALRARTRFAPGALNPGVAPAALADAVRKAASTPVRDATALSVDSLADFDRAMLAGLEKYRAASARRDRARLDVSG